LSLKTLETVLDVGGWDVGRDLGFVFFAHGRVRGIDAPDGAVAIKGTCREQDSCATLKNKHGNQNVFGINFAK